MFSDETRERFRLGKYTRWAVGLTEAQLEALLWIIGEFGYGAHCVLPLLTDLWRSEGSGRAVLALESLFRAVGGDRPDVDAYTLRVRTFLAEVRGYAEEGGEPPAHNWPVAWQGRSVGWITAPVLEEYGCSCSGVWWPDAAGAADFLAAAHQRLTERIQVSVGGIPALVKSLPDEAGRMAFWLHVSPNAYELLRPPEGEPGGAAERPRE
jgi:hypothetical protein